MISEAYKYFRWLSLDIVLGAIFFLAFLANHYQTRLEFSVYFGLASATWIIYNTDHLIDAFKSAESERRQFHKRIFKPLLVAIGIVLVAGLINIYFLPEEIIRNGALLSGACVAYLLCVFFFPGIWCKELLVALGYTLGVFLGPFSIKAEFSGLDALMIFQLVLIALINLLVFSMYDTEQDSTEKFGSLVNRLGLVQSKKLMVLTVVASLTLCGLALVLFPELWNLELIYLSMTLVLVLVAWRPVYFGINERFRLVGDAVFYVPVLFLIW